MARLLRGRWLFALLALVLLVALLSYRAYFSSTNAAIRHAEGFLFRRMSVAQLAEQSGYRFFYASNRVPGTDETDLAQRFTSQRQNQLSFAPSTRPSSPASG